MGFEKLDKNDVGSVTVQTLIPGNIIDAFEVVSNPCSNICVLTVKLVEPPNTKLSDLFVSVEGIEDMSTVWIYIFSPTKVSDLFSWLKYYLVCLFILSFTKKGVISIFYK